MSTLVELRAKQTEHREKILDVAKNSSSLAEAGRKVGVSRERVRQLVRAAGLVIRTRVP